MKNSTLKNLMFIICVSFFSSNLFAQGPADPGNDPLNTDLINENVSVPTNQAEVKKDDQLVYIFQNASAISSQVVFSNKSKIHFSHLSERKYDLFFDEKPIANFSSVKRTDEEANQYTFNFIK